MALTDPKKLAVITHPNFRLKRAPARSQVRAITIAVNQDAFDRIMALVEAGTFENPGAVVQAALEDRLGLQRGESMPSKLSE
jgi:hypothetical protein